MVVRIDPTQPSLALLSLPRDLWVAIPDIGEGKINSAYVLGQRIGNGAGVAAATVGRALGIRIDHTAVIDFEGFRNVVDALGGIPVNVSRELYDPQFPTDDYGATTVQFLPGTEVMDGARALTYSRIRRPDSDFARMQRQQAVVLGMVRRVQQRGALKNMQEADKLTAALQPFVRTDLPRSDVVDLLWSMRSLNVDMIKRMTLDASLLRETTIGGSYALIANAQDLYELGARLSSP